MINLTSEIGRGKERACFLHPQDSRKVIKIVYTQESKQMQREIDAYKDIAMKADIEYEHFPNYYGEVETDKGTGYVFDLVQNSDGSSPRTLHSYLEGLSCIEDLDPQLSGLKAYLLKHSIVFCNDVSYEGNILVKELADGSAKLVIIDGLGDVVYFTWVNKINFLVKRKIERRWSKLMERLESIKKTS